jgi:cellulose synthase/poly-beta-1,6-N-acetylglucosamine synthase-like glycosyltransferase
MTFRYSRQGLSEREHRLERLFEIVPGAASWATLLGMLLLALWRPFAAAVLIIAFDLYWLLRLLYMTVFLVLSYVRLSREEGTDWMAKTQALDRQPGPRPLSSELRHLIIIPIANESRAVYEPGLQGLLAQPFPPRQILVVLAVEARSPAEVKAEAESVQQRYRGQFLDLLVVIHPDGLPGEARVKGANVTCAAKAAAAHCEERSVPFDRVIVSCFDADTVVSPGYLACLTYHFLACPDRTRASFQPIPVYHNNIWTVPWFARVLDVGASFFQLVEATNPETLVTFSSHSMSFQALVEMGYWPVDMISDDSAVFWKAFIHYDGAYRTVPMPVTVSMDVAASASWQRTAANVYKQKRRWAWGVENFPIVMRGFLRARNIPLARKLAHGWKLLEGHVAWATWPFLLGVIGWVPALFAGREFSNTVVYYSAPRITLIIFRLASISLLLTIVLSLALLPRAPTKLPWLKKLGHAFEWLLVPAIAIFLSAIPALDAQTRLMRGKYLEFWVTEKTR